MIADKCWVCDGPVDAGDEPGEVPMDSGAMVPVCSVACTEKFFASGEIGPPRAAVKPTVDTSPYRRSHGAEPRGRGSWAFVFGQRNGLEPTATRANALVDATPATECWFAPGSITFGAAKKLALAEAKRLGATLVAVCP